MTTENKFLRLYAQQNITSGNTKLLRITLDKLKINSNMTIPEKLAYHHVHMNITNVFPHKLFH